MNLRKGFFRLTWVLSFSCGILSLYFPDNVFENPAFNDRRVRIALPGDWVDKTLQEKLDLVNNLDINLPKWVGKAEEKIRQEEEEEKAKKDEGFTQRTLPPLHSRVLDNYQWGPPYDYRYYDLSSKDKLKVKKKLRKIITSPAKLLPLRDLSNLFEGRYSCVFIGPDWTKISFLILKPFTIGFATIWIIYAVIRWVVMGFFAGGFKDKK